MPEDSDWDALTENQKRERRARFVSDPYDLVVIRLDPEARNEVAEAGREFLSEQD